MSRELLKRAALTISRLLDEILVLGDYDTDAGALLEDIEVELAKPEYQLSDDGLETLGDFLDLIKIADDKDVTKGLCQELVLRAYHAGKKAEKEKPLPEPVAWYNPENQYLSLIQIDDTCLPVYLRESDDKQEIHDSVNKARESHNCFDKDFTFYDLVFDSAENKDQTDNTQANSEDPNKQYLAKFRQFGGPMGMNAIDYYAEDGKIIEHIWGMGGASWKVVESVPDEIEGYEKIYPITRQERKC